MHCCPQIPLAFPKPSILPFCNAEVRAPTLQLHPMAAAEPEPGWQHRGGPIGTPLWLWGRRCLRALGSFAPNPIRLAARAARGKVLSAGSCGGSAARSSLPASLGAGGALSPARCPQAASRLLFFRCFFLLFFPPKFSLFSLQPRFPPAAQGMLWMRSSPAAPRSVGTWGWGEWGGPRVPLFWYRGGTKLPSLGEHRPGGWGCAPTLPPFPTAAGCGMLPVQQRS